MAENKIVNTTQLDADLTSIANAIREKAGLSDSIAFPSGFVDAIANITTGGGVPSGFSAFTSGTFTPTSDISGDQEIEHGLGVTPNFYFLIALSSINEDKNLMVSQLALKKQYIYGSSQTAYEGVRLSFWKYSPYADSLAGLINSHTENWALIDRVLTDTKIVTRAVNTARFGSGATYLWVCGVIEGLV